MQNHFNLRIQKVYLLGLVAELVGLVSAGGAVDAGDLVVLSVLPGTV
jgi:hypothetical protein